ncbi:MAG: serine/threonine protein kinase [Thermosynechococcaceae cyanobacterium]
MSPELAPSALALGTSLQQGKYRLDQILSQVDYTITYQATHRGLDQTVVIQTLCDRNELQANRASLVQRFIANAQKRAKVYHPHLIHVNDLFIELDLPFMVTDDAVGASLGKIALKKAIPEQQALDYLRQAAAAVTRLHQHHCLHGNLSPDAFVLRSQDHQIMLTDLGLERELTPGVPSPSLEGYISPEQYRPPQGLTPAADVYALAASLYALVTGHRPVSALAREQNPLSPPRQLCPQLSAETEQAILSGMEIKAADRPQTIEQWLSLLTPSTTASPPAVATSVAAPVIAKTELSSPSADPIPTPNSSPLPSATPKIMASIPKSAPRPPHPFPMRALFLASGVAGVMGLAIGFVLRFQYLTQFSPPQVSNNPIGKVKRESFPPRTNTDHFDQQDNPSQNLTLEPSREREALADVDPQQQEYRGNRLEDRPIRDNRPPSPDRIIESKIEDFSPELTPNGITVSPHQDSPANPSDWSDILPNRSAYRTDSQDAAVDSERSAGSAPSRDLDREFRSPQI